MVTSKAKYILGGSYNGVGVTERLGLEDKGGMVRVGPVYYNTLEENERFGEVLMRVSSGVALKRSGSALPAC